jgi:hypothetical protein
MIRQLESTQLLLNVNALKGQASKTAYQGTGYSSLAYLTDITRASYHDN